MKTLKRFAIFREMKLSKSNIFSKESFSYISENGKPGKNYLYFKKTELSYISGNGTFLYFLKKMFFLNFRRRIFKTLAYLELEAYSEPWYIHNPRHIISMSKIYDGTFYKK